MSDVKAVRETNMTQDVGFLLPVIGTSCEITWAGKSVVCSLKAVCVESVRGVKAEFVYISAAAVLACHTSDVEVTLCQQFLLFWHSWHLFLTLFCVTGGLRCLDIRFSSFIFAGFVENIEEQVSAVQLSQSISPDRRANDALFLHSVCWQMKLRFFQPVSFLLFTEPQRDFQSSWSQWKTNPESLSVSNTR